MRAKKYLNEPYKWGRRGLREILPDNFSAITGIFHSLRHRNFALYYAGQCVSLIGSWIQQIAMGWLIFDLSGSVLTLSISVFLAQIPTLFLTSFTGLLSDKFSRKKILLTTQSLFMIQAFILAFLGFTGLANIPLLLVLSFSFGLIVCFEAPTRQSFYAQLVPKEDLSNAIALNSTIINGSRFIGPAIGGVLIAQIGASWCFFINGLSFVATIFALVLIKPRRLEIPPLKESIFKSLFGGWAYMAKSLPMRSTISLLAVASFSAVPFPMLMPAFAKGVLGGDSELLGNLVSCVGLGALAAALFLAARKSAKGLGKVITASCALMGLSLAILSQVKDPEIACFLCVPFGFGMIAVAASSNTVLQTLADDSIRGRIMGIFTMCFFGIPPIGSLVQGWLANRVGLDTVSLVSGIVCMLAAAIFEFLRPSIRKNARRARTPQGVLPEIASALQDADKMKNH